jgi:hypothetical protein
VLLRKCTLGSSVPLADTCLYFSLQLLFENVFQSLDKYLASYIHDTSKRKHRNVGSGANKTRMFRQTLFKHTLFKFHENPLGGCLFVTYATDGESSGQV